MNNDYHLLSAYQVSGIVLSIIFALIHLIFKEPKQVIIIFTSIFTDKQTEEQNG